MTDLHIAIPERDDMDSGKSDGAHPLTAHEFASSTRPATRFWLTSVSFMGLAYVFDSTPPLGWLFFGLSVVAAFLAARCEDAEGGSRQ
jgi:hypothetical protein